MKKLIVIMLQSIMSGSMFFANAETITCEVGCKINFGSEGGGIATVNGLTSIEVPANTKVQLVATPEKGYMFDGWYYTDGGSGEYKRSGYAESSSSPVTVYNNDDEDSRLWANFKPATDGLITDTVCAITDVTTSGGNGSYTMGGGTVTCNGQASVRTSANSTVTLVANPSVGYRFKGWYYRANDDYEPCSNSFVSPSYTSSSVTYNNDDENSTIYAIFQKEPDDSNVKKFQYNGEIYNFWHFVSTVNGDKEYEIWDAQDGCIDMYYIPPTWSGTSGKSCIAVPVNVISGSLEEEDVKIELKGVVNAGELGEVHVCSEADFIKMITPVAMSKWTAWSEYHDWEYDDDNKGIWCEYSRSIWPNKEPVEGRVWAYAECKVADGNWSGHTWIEFSVMDDDGWSEVARAEVNRYQAKQNFSAEKLYAGSTFTMSALNNNWWVAPYNRHNDISDQSNNLEGEWFDWIYQTDGAKLTFNVKEAGRLVIEYWPDGDECLSASGSIVASQSNDEHDGIPNSWNPSYTLTVNVSRAGSFTISSDEWSDMYIGDIAFYPTEGNSVNVKTSFFDVYECTDGWYEHEYVRGYVTGGGVYKAGEQAVLTAIPGRNAMFDHWECECEVLTLDEKTSRVLKINIPKELCGSADEMAQFSIRAVWRDRTSDDEEQYTFVPGEEVVIDTGLIGYTVKGLPSGLKYDKNTGKITGAAKTPTSADGVTVTFIKSGAEAETMTIIVGAIPKVTLTMSGDTDGCKATGAGAYLYGKKVSLSATAPKGTAFVGWYANGELVSNVAKYSFTMGAEDIAFTAKFEKEKMSVGCAGLVEGEFVVGLAGGANGIPLEIETQSGVKSVAVSKLPSGMKYDAKSGTITGAPSKAGEYTVEIKVTANSGAVETKKITITVASLPSVAYGTFNGFVWTTVDNELIANGSLSLAVTDVGKITAKVTTAAGSYSFSGTGWDAYEDGRYSVKLASKKETLTLELDTGAVWNGYQVSGTLNAGGKIVDVAAQRKVFGQPYYFTASGDAENGWTLAYAADAKSSALTVTPKADGTVTLAGTVGGNKVSASGFIDVARLTDGAMLCDFTPVVSVKNGKATAKRTLYIRTNLWFDRKSDHDDGIGSAKFVE